MPIILYDLIQRRLVAITNSKAIIFDCFVKLGSLVTVLYMQNIETSLDIYVEKMRYCTQELDALSAPKKTVKKTVISSTLKMHLLSHLHEDILRFGSPIRYETERGEQYKKFIREHRLHTNRQSPSCDVAISFGKKCISTHIFQGGYWQVSGHGSLFTSGAEVKLFQQFHPLVLSRKLADNKSSSKSIVVGLVGLFSFSSGASPVFEYGYHCTIQPSISL
ncbi:hypothetical protein BDF14DRAFT_1862860 [Spinellus fusiger]|nr:hypothetical protein BDF14DRAFT_1862860 [Spinellus fusiger]